MPRAKTSWGFPKWGSYGAEREAATVRECDYEGCIERGSHPAPKSPLSDEKWWFCRRHAGEYNRNWNFFEGMTADEARSYARGERDRQAGYSTSEVYGWGGAADSEGLTVAERKAYETLELEPNAKGREIKANYRRLAKKYHPDTNAGKSTVRQFQKVKTAYEILRPRIKKPAPGD